MSEKNSHAFPVSSSSTISDSNQQPKTPPLSPITKRFTSLRENVLCSDPYILGLESTDPHRPLRWGQYLARGTPFDSNEAQLQYISFLQHPWTDGGLMVYGGWADNHGNLLPEDPYKTSSRSTTTTPVLSSARRKITLGEYKNKSRSNPSKDIEGNKGEFGPLLKSTQPAMSKQESTQENHSSHLKRPLDSMAGLKEPKSREVVEPTPPSKRARVTPPPKQSHPPTSESNETMKSNPNEIPKLLSPLHATFSRLKSPSNALDIPPLLSPTLPPIIMRKLEAQKQLSSSQSSTLSKGSHNRTSSTTSTSSESRPKNATKIPLAGKTVKSHTITSHSTAGTPERKPRATAHIPTSHQTKTINNTTSGKSSKVVELPIESKIIKLKYGKGRRKFVERILGIRARPSNPLEAGTKRSATQAAKPKESATDPSGVFKPLKASQERRDPKTNLTQRSSEKRLRSDDEDSSVERSIKKKKTLQPLKESSKPSTPAEPNFKSPAPPHPTLPQKSHITPRQDIKNVALRRVESSSGKVRTPQGEVRSATPSAPNSVERKTPFKTTNSSEPSASHREAREWHMEHQKYLSIGRNLKHTGDAILRPGIDKISEVDRGLCAATMAEGLICYVLAFTLLDHANRLSRASSPVVSNWNSLLPYAKTVLNITRYYPQLHGFCLQVVGRVYNVIGEGLINRLAADQLPIGSTEEVLPPTPGTEGDLAAAEVAKKNALYRRDYIEFQRELIDTSRKADSTWLEGNALFTVEDIMTKFPNTWNACKKSPLDLKGADKLVPQNGINGAFALPLNSSSAPIEFVRAGWSLLGEWSMKEGIKWEGKLEL
ncbi:MAG: hypothetical protein M1834_005808 [Cirrosporium novae-zelandiae]|nr:MAG: hypothetical protein M1834_005808 [Cirrosporium novae-zelandiae]